MRSKVFIILLSLLWLCGCRAHKRISDIGTAQHNTPIPAGTPWAIPTGIVVSPEERGSRDIDGLYPSTVPNDRACCWIGTQARITTMKPASATWLDLTVFVPDYTFFRTHTQSLDVALDDGSYTHHSGLKPGVHTLRFTLPSQLQRRSDNIDLRLRTQYAFVPANEHINSDTRELGIIVLRVDYGM